MPSTRLPAIPPRGMARGVVELAGRDPARRLDHRAEPVFAASGEWLAGAGAGPDRPRRLDQREIRPR